MEFYPALPAGAIPRPGKPEAARRRELSRCVPQTCAGSAGEGCPPWRPRRERGAPWSGEPLVFCHQVTTAPTVVRRGGKVQAGGWLTDHVTLGVLQAHLPAGEIAELIEDFGCAEERRRLLPAAVAVRLVLAMTLLRMRISPR